MNEITVMQSYPDRWISEVKTDKPFGKGNLRRNCDLAFASLNSYDSSAEVSCFAIHFDALLKELLLWENPKQAWNFKRKKIQKGKLGDHFKPKPPLCRAGLLNLLNRNTWISIQAT